MLKFENRVNFFRMSRDCASTVSCVSYDTTEKLRPNYKFKSTCLT